MHICMYLCMCVPSTGGSRRPLAHTGAGRCNGAPSQTSKTSRDEDGTTGHHAASHGRAPRWCAMGQERQWPWSTGGPRRPLAHTGTCGTMAHRCGRAKLCLNGLFASSCLEFEMAKIQRLGATLRAMGGARGGTPWGSI